MPRRKNLVIKPAFLVAIKAHLSSIGNFSGGADHCDTPRHRVPLPCSFGSPIRLWWMHWVWDDFSADDLGVLIA